MQVVATTIEGETAEALIKYVKGLIGRQRREEEAQEKAKQQIEADMRKYLTERGIAAERHDAIFDRVGRYTAAVAESMEKAELEAAKADGKEVKIDEDRVMPEFILALELVAMQVRRANAARVAFDLSEKARDCN